MPGHWLPEQERPMFMYMKSSSPCRCWKVKLRLHLGNLAEAFKYFRMLEHESMYSGCLTTIIFLE